MNLLKNILPIEKGYQILYKTVAMGTNKRKSEILEALSCKTNIKIDFIKEENNEVDKNAIAIYMSGTRKYFIFFEKEINNRIGYVKKEIAKNLNDYTLIDDIVFRATSMYLNKNGYINFYFDILIKKTKFKELKENEEFIKNYEKEMSNFN